MRKEFQYYLIYKPYGMLSQFSKDNENDLTLKDLDFHFPNDIYPVGRLDKDSEGLLLLTNDNKLKTILTDPEQEKKKVYWIQVDGKVDESILKRFINGNIEIKIKGKIHRCKPAKARLIDHSEVEHLPERHPPIRFRKNIPTSWLEIELTEGKNRQIRKMTAQIGHPTLRLIRVRIENLQFEEWSSGKVKELSREELDDLNLK